MHRALYHLDQFLRIPPYFDLEVRQRTSSKDPDYFNPRHYSGVRDGEPDRQHTLIIMTGGPCESWFTLNLSLMRRYVHLVNMLKYLLRGADRFLCAIIFSSRSSCCPRVLMRAVKLISIRCPGK